MAITKINTPELFDLGTTNSSFRLPSGDTASRPTNPNTGEWRYNTDDNYVEYWDGSAWFQIDYEAVAPTCTTDTINYPSGTTNTAYYKMSDATDSTLNGYNGTATNVNFNVAGKFGNAGEFNGSSSKINTSLTLDTNTVNGGSISLWFKTSQTTPAQILLGSQTAQNGASYGTSILLGHATSTSSQESFTIWDYNGGTTSMFYTEGGSTFYQDGEWHHLVITSTSTTKNIYIDGVSQTVSYSASGSASANLKFTDIQIAATLGYTGTSYFDGSIDQVRIFPTALTSDQVTQLYNEVQCVPTIVPSDYFNPLLYTGNSGTQSIDDLTFQPDLVWIKNRDNAYSHQLYDSVRGTGSSKNLQSDNTSAEGADANLYGFLSSFDSNGYTVQSGTSSGFTNIWTNQSGQDYVAWNWKAGGAPTATNSAGAGNVPTAGSVKIDGADSTTALAGTIAATSISANTEAGFSIVKWTGDGTNASIGHGLSSTPEMIIIKPLEVQTAPDWKVYHSALGLQKVIYLNLTQGTDPILGPYWGSINATTFGQDGADISYLNINNKTYIAYCFHSVDGMSDIGSYVGTGVAGNTIVTGFRPAFLMVKRSNSTGNWCIVDNKRNPTNERNKFLFANQSVAEQDLSAFNTIDFTSNGFILQETGALIGDTNININGSTYIYLAIAEQVYNANAVTANQTNPFNDGSQIAQYEFEDNAYDSQPNGYIGKGGTFNGSSSYISGLPTVENTSGEFSISLWFNTTVNPSVQHTMLGGIKEQGTNDSVVALKMTSDGYSKLYLRGTDGTLHILADTVDATDGNWHHLVGTVNGSNAILYVDGSQVDTATISNNVTVDNLLIGAENNRASLNPTNYFNGSIDQVRIYNTVLNPNDVWLLYSETSATSSTLDYPASTGAVALYELEGNANDTGGTYNGTATDVAWVPLYDGTPTSMTYAAPSVSTPFLKAGVFNGSSSYIDLGNTINTTYVTPTGSFSTSVWVNFSSVGSSIQQIINSSTNANIELALNGASQGAGKIVLSLWNGSYVHLISTTTVVANTWYHIAVTHNNGSWSLYINGSSEATGTKTIVQPTTEPLVLGKRQNNTQYLNGKLDQVRIFNKALDSGEVTQLYNEPNN